MEQQNTRLRNAGFATFFFSGICAISAGVVVSLLQERYGFAYGMTGTLLSLMSVGNLLAGLLMGMLPSALGMKRSVLLLTIGYAVGYGLMGLTGLPILLALAFFIVGIAKGSVLNTCTILVSGNSADRTRGMNLMHSCYACGALLCPFLIAAAAKVSTELAVFLLAALGLHTRQAAPAVAKQPAPLSDTERRVLAGIGPKPVGIEELCVSTGLPMSALLGTLMKLELTGRVYKQPGQRYVLR